MIFPLGFWHSAPSDQLGQHVAKLLINPGPSRDRLTAGCYLPDSVDEPVGAIEQALAATLEAEPVEAKIRDLEKRGAFINNPLANVRDIAEAAFAIGGISQEEYDIAKRRNALRDAVVKVDDFPFDLGHSSSTASVGKPEEVA